MLDVKFGHSDDLRSAVADSLMRLLADVAVAASKAQTYHWNVEGAPHGPTERLFREIVLHHVDEQDDLAERLRALGARPVARPSRLSAQSRLTECDGALDGAAMAAALASDQRALAEACRRLAAEALAASDLATADLAEECAGRHSGFARSLSAQSRETP